MSFRDIKGQDRAIDFLRASIKRKTLSHSYIFFGPRGTGRFTTALEVAKALNCARGDGEACDECPTCRKIASKNHMDLILVSPDDKGTGEVKIGMIRELQHRVNLKPYEMQRKVCVIDSADRMTPDAANALLKTLEEPPADSVLILIVENLTNILPTIASRCRQVRFYSLSEDELEGMLRDRLGLDGSRSRPIARLSSGSVGEAVRLSGGDAVNKKNRIIDSLRSGSLFDDEASPVQKEDMPWALDVMLSWQRDVVMAALTMGKDAYINIDRAEEIEKDAHLRLRTIEDLLDIVEEIGRCRYCLERNVNPKLAWAHLGAVVKRK